MLRKSILVSLFVVASLASYRPPVPNSPLVPVCGCFSLDGKPMRPCACPVILFMWPSWSWSKWVNWSGNFVEAADLDPRAETTVRLSPLECVSIWSRVHTKKLTSEAESDALERVSTACEFAKIDAKVDAAKKANKKDLPDSDFPGPRVARKLPRDALDLLVTWLIPTKDEPTMGAQDATFRQLRREFREVLASRDPYATTTRK